MTEIAEKLRFSALVRYFFSGVVVALGIAIVRPAKLTMILEQVRDSTWATNFPTLATISGVMLLLVGYVSFTFYRSLIFESVILRIKGGLNAIPFVGKSFYSYRELIQEIMNDEVLGAKRINKRTAERLYRILKREVAPKFYNQHFDTYATGLHFLYFVALTGMISFVCDRMPRFVIYSGILFVLTLYADVSFEKEELLLFIRGREKLTKALTSFKDHPAWSKAAQVEEPTEHNPTNISITSEHSGR